MVSDDGERLSAGTQVHVGRQPARTYRDELKRLRAVELDEWDALRVLERIVVYAKPVEVDLDLEAWAAVDADHQLAILARVVRWQSHVAVISAAVHDASKPTISGAQWTEAALEQYASARGYRGHDVERAAAELTIAIHWATDVDSVATPESWRYRGGVDKLEVSLAVQRIDRQGTPLVVAAEPRDGRRRLSR